MRLRVLHLAGSMVDEFHAELSRLYARDCLRATADAQRYEFVVAHVSPGGPGAPGGWWRFPADLSDAALAAVRPCTLAEAVARIAAEAPDVVVPQLFCRPGQTSVRALIEVLGLPYVGNTPTVMALGADKALARAVVAAAGMAVPAGQLVRAGEPATIAPPAVVKPVDADNSFGVTLVRERADYPAALDAALAHSPTALVETYVELGREVRCGIVEVDGSPVALPLEEYRVDDVRTRSDKLARDDGGDLRLVAKDPTRAWIVDPDDPVTAPAQEMALACHRALGCRHHGLFDLRVDPDGIPWFLEASLYSSFATQSVLTVMAGAAGIPLAELFAGQLRAARS